MSRGRNCRHFGNSWRSATSTARRCGPTKGVRRTWRNFLVANDGGSVPRTLNESLFPPEIMTLLRTLSEAGFFERSLLVGSWVMPIYRELYGVSYTLRTLDVDL